MRFNAASISPDDSASSSNSRHSNPKDFAASYSGSKIGSGSLRIDGFWGKRMIMNRVLFFHGRRSAVLIGNAVHGWRTANGFKASGLLNQIDLPRNQRETQSERLGIVSSA